MNWTGGRLQRHSLGSNRANTRSVREVQKQHFARARMAVRNGRTAGVSPSKRARRREDETGPNRETRERRGATAAEIKQKGIGSRPKRPYCGGDETGQRDSSASGGKPSLDTETGPDVDSIRRSLLSQPDWANLSLARPLKTRPQPSLTERDNFAKRRRLTDDERHRRLAATTLPGENGRHGEGGFALYDDRSLRAWRRLEAARKASPTSGLTSDGISVRIGGRGTGRSCRGVSATPASQSRAMQMISQESEESMLFDREEKEKEGEEAHFRGLFPVSADGYLRSDRREEHSSTESLQGQRDSEPMMSDAPTPAEDREEGQLYEQEQQQQQQRQLEMSSSPKNSVDLPPLDPRGSFSTTRDGQTRYNPPGRVPSPAAMTQDQGHVPIQRSPAITAASSPTKSIHPTQRRVPLWVPEDVQASEHNAPDAWRHAADWRNDNTIISASSPDTKKTANRPEFSNEIPRLTAPSDGLEDGESIWRRFIFGPSCGINRP